MSQARPSRQPAAASQPSSGRSSPGRSSPPPPSCPHAPSSGAGSFLNTCNFRRYNWYFPRRESNIVHCRSSGCWPAGRPAILWSLVLVAARGHWQDGVSSPRRSGGARLESDRLSRHLPLWESQAVLGCRVLASLVPWLSSCGLRWHTVCAAVLVGPSVASAPAFLPLQE